MRRDASDSEARSALSMDDRTAGQPQPLARHAYDPAEAKIREACIMEYPNSTHAEWAMICLSAAAIWLAIVAGLSLL
jgi:hypothetical protein